MDRRLNGTISKHAAFGSVNATQDRGRIYLERVPTWAASAATWGCGWQIHVYGLSACYFTLCLLSGVALVLIRKRRKAYRSLNFALLMLFITGLMRGFYYALDPYDYNNDVPATLNRLLLQLANPALSGAYSAIQRMILRLTKLDVGSSKLQKTSFIATVIFFHFLITLLVEAVVGENHNTKALLILSHGYFIVWTSFLCVSYIYNGFKLTHYTSETQRAFKDLSCYSQAKRNDHISNEKQITRSTTQQRLMKPMIKITNEENKTCSIVSEPDDSTASDFEDSQNSTSFSKGESDKETENISSSRKKMVNRTPQSGFQGQTCKYESSCEYHERQNEHQQCVSETSSDVSDVEASTGVCLINKTPARILRGFRKQNMKPFRDGEMLVGRTLSRYSSSSHSKRGKVKRKESRLDNSVISEVFPRGYCTDLQLRSMGDCIVCDTGYMADTESSFMQKNTSKSNKQTSSCSDSKDADFRVVNAVSVVTSPSTLSLHRIRQGRMIHKVTVATYVTTFLGFIVCLLHLYSVFGSYGIFGSNPVPDPWPWLLFQTFTRLTEIGMGGAVGVAGFIVIRHRKQRSGLRKGGSKKTLLGCLI